MAVNLYVPKTVASIAGLRLLVAQAGVKYSNRNDVLVICLQEGSRVAGVFTQNRFCAAPVQICKKHLAQEQPIRALIVNTGNANAGTGELGLQQAFAVCKALANQLDCRIEQILPFSTGVILEPLPADKIISALPRQVEVGWHEAAAAIMTTDTCPKMSTRVVEWGEQQICVTGISKGAGMIHPNMATMLGFIATDAAVSQSVLDALVQELADASFNSITVDGDTSTNDSFILISTGASKVSLIDSTLHPAFSSLRQALIEVAIELAQAIVRDGEGATKFITVKVEAGESVAECRAVAYAIARSPLVKTAFFASDPNLGRILCAIGYAGIGDFSTECVDLYLDDVQVVKEGQRCSGYREEMGLSVMKKSEILVRVVLHRGTAEATVWTCDLSYDYIKTNAEYRS